jgi:hypothetical protein
MNKITFFCFCFFILVATISVAQDSEDSETLDTKTLAYGLTTNNYSGFIGGAVLRSSTPLSTKNGKAVHRYIAIEAVNIKNAREKGEIGNTGSKYVFGKTNYLISLRPEFGREFYIFTKDGENTIGFSAIFAAGPSIGLEKPYYIKYANKTGTETVPYDPNIHIDKNKFVGASSIFQNMFKGLKLNPGFHVKAASNIDMSTFNNNVTGMEIGTVFEFFSKEPEIISSKFSKNQQSYATVYLTLYFGNKKLLKKKKL